MRHALSVAVCTALLCAPVSARAQPSERILPASSPWQADFGDESCTLNRTFGEGDQQVMLQLRKFAPVAGTQFTVFGSSLTHSGERLRFRLPGVSEAVAPSMQVNREFEGGLTGTTVSMSLTSNTIEAGDEGGLLTIESGFGEPFALHAGSLGRPLEVLEHCTKNLLRVWGVTQSVDDPRPSRARLTNSERLREELVEKYNGLSFDSRADGRLHLRIMVDAEGKALSCHNQDVGEMGDFAEKACETVMRTARFRPGKSKEGENVTSYALFSASFKKG